MYWSYIGLLQESYLFQAIHTLPIIIVGLFPGYYPVDAYCLSVAYSCCLIDKLSMAFAGLDTLSTDFVCCTCSHHDNADR